MTWRPTKAFFMVFIWHPLNPHILMFPTSPKDSLGMRFHEISRDLRILCVISSITWRWLPPRVRGSGSSKLEITCWAGAQAKTPWTSDTIWSRLYAVARIYGVRMLVYIHTCGRNSRPVGIPTFPLQDGTHKPNRIWIEFIKKHQVSFRVNLLKEFFLMYVSSTLAARTLLFAPICFDCQGRFGREGEDGFLFSWRKTTWKLCASFLILICLSNLPCDSEEKMVQNTQWSST